MQNIEPTPPIPEEYDKQAIDSLIAEGDRAQALRLIPSVLRMELLAIKPLGEQWTKHLNSIVNRLTELGSISIITPIVTKDSDEQ